MKFFPRFSFSISLPTGEGWGGAFFRVFPLFVFVSGLTTSAQNPIIRDQFAADPTARVFGGRVYLYPSHDILPPEGQRQDWFCMADYHVFSSDNLREWTDHGVILTQQDVQWGKPDGYSMWAPDCVEKDGRYYFYFPDAPREGRGFAIGVATATSPTGPFTPEAKSIEGVAGIDPCVLVDDDGQAYIYWSGMGLRGARLKSDMKSIDSSEEMKGLPEGFKEGPFAFKRDGRYYLTFPWVRGKKGVDSDNPTETLAYAMSDSPLGPWDFKGIIMAEHANSCWTNHHSIVNINGEWLLFYHHNDYSPGDDKRRSPHIDRLQFNADGTIREVKPTLRGVGTTPATARIEVDRYSQLKTKESTFSSFCSSLLSFNDSADTFRGWHVTLPHKGSWLRYDGVDFGSITDGYVIVCAKADTNTSLSIREKSDKGKVLARVDVTVTGAQGPFRRDLRGQWLTLTAPLDYIPKGVTDLVVTCDDAPVSIDWLQFKQRPGYFSLVDKKAAPSRPDADGFIRRWHLREPARQDIRSNIVFTNTWLRQVFASEQARLSPKKDKWYILESETYNMRLFRFAEKYGKQTYGNLFWCEAIIDCPADIADVRLAAGSNGASMWWIDGDEVLLLEGDRRMVVDDGVSQRLTLKRGCHTVRGAVINGPGLSDMCVRLINEQGKPITDYQIQ